MMTSRQHLRGRKPWSVDESNVGPRRGTRDERPDRRSTEIEARCDFFIHIFLCEGKPGAENWQTGRPRQNRIYSIYFKIYILYILK